MDVGTSLLMAGLPGDLISRITVVFRFSFVRLYAPKNHRRSMRNGPPSSPPKSPRLEVSVTVVVHAGRLSRVLSLAWRNPPSALTKADPRKLLLPLFVTTLITPPVIRPYSAGRPPVLTSTSCTKSKLSVLPLSPTSTPVVLRPSMMYWFSAPDDP